jgi:hypothetical protein
MKTLFVAVGLAAICLLSGQLPALAWTFLGEFPSSRLNQYYTPNHGNRWAQIVWDGNDRYIHVDANELWWTSSRVHQMRMATVNPHIVFHLFHQDTNCQLRFDFTGFWWSDSDNPWVRSKADTCPGNTADDSYHNEVRIGFHRGTLEPLTDYEVGAEFQDRSSNPPDNGEANYDTYFGGAKRWMGKFYFESDDTLRRE